MNDDVKPSDRLKEIEGRITRLDSHGLVVTTTSEYDWLVSRVKTLTEALEFYAIPGHMECDSGLQARKALEGEV